MKLRLYDYTNGPFSVGLKEKSKMHYATSHAYFYIHRSENDAMAIELSKLELCPISKNVRDV